MRIALALLALTLAVSGLAQADQRAESRSEVTDAAGTTVKSDASRETSTTWGGTKKTEVDETKVTDPRGMMNKTKETFHQEARLEKDGDHSEVTKKVDAAGTERKIESEKSTSENLFGKGGTTTTTRKETVDPKGLMNKSTSEVEDRAEVNNDGSVERTVTKKVDGETVSETTTAK